jgi:hypothetical protein
MFWRMRLYKTIVPERSEEAIIIGSGSEMSELIREVNGNPHYHFKFTSTVDLGSLDAKAFKEDMTAKIKEGSPLIVIDFYNPKSQAILPDLYNLLLSGVRFIDMHRIYESVFGREALSLLSHN